jgi:TonB-linked SusC/RagA family outer membrane protein
MRTYFTKRLRIAVLMCIAMLFFNYVNAQITVSGKVMDEADQPLPGVNIVIKGTTQGTSVDADGMFKMQVPDASAVLVFSFVGYLSEEVTVGTQTELQVRLMPDISSLSEVVVIGYGTQRSTDVTGAVASLNSDDFLVGKVQDATDMIKGKVAGLIITKSSGDPNASSHIMLRGVTTLQGNVSPLILINGVPGDITTVAPENVESISILKDASAAAIYGTRGANGVIIIKTKSGKREQAARVNYTGYLAVSDFYKRADFMGPYEVRRGLNSFQDQGWDTDWVGAITQNGMMQNHSLTIDGGGKNSTYAANFSYRNEDGTIRKTNNDQYRLQFNFDQYLFKDIVKINMNILKEYHLNTINNASNGGITNIYRQAVIRNPTSPIYDETTGGYHEEFNRYQYYNPVAMLNELMGENENESTNLIGNITVEPISRWKTNLMLSNNLYNQAVSSYTTSEYFASTTTGYAGSANKSYYGFKQKALELTSTYDFSLSKHRFTVLGGYSYFYQKNEGFSAGNSDFPTDSYLYNNLGVGSLLKEGKAGMSSFKDDATLISFFGRLQYSFNEKFNLMATIRREGSSKFGENHQWGVFPAVSAGWTISEEGFVQSLSWIDNLKLRAGYGVTGQAPQSSYLSLTLYNYDANFGNYLNENGEWVAGLMVTQNPNPELKWEKTAEVNIGLDFAFLNNRVSGSIDVYNKETTDLLYYYNVPVPPNMYGQTLANVGSIRNNGIEILLSGTPVKSSDFDWTTTLTVTHNQNKLLSLSNDLYETNNFMNVAYAGDPITVPTHRVEVGKAMGNYWGLKSVGVTDDGLWLVENPQTGEAEPYSTAMNSDTYRQYLGNGFPKVYLGWNNSFRYKNFDLNIQMSGQFGFKILNEQRMFYENNSIQYNRLKSAADPVYGNVPLSSAQAQAFVSYYLEDGSFVKFDNVTLGYNFKLNNLANYISGVRVYTSAQNFLTITGYDGMDPELGNADFFAAGNDFRDKYPTIQSLTVGLNVTFK